MSWSNIEEKLEKALTVTIAFPAGTIWLPVSHLTIDDWLTSIAESDEELSELNIPRIRFLQNRWPIVRLVELEWDDEFSNRRFIAAMHVGHRAYILFSDWSEYQVIAAIEPKDNPSLYQTVIGKILENRSFIPTRPNHIRYRRPDLVPELFGVSAGDFGRKKSRIGENFGGLMGQPGSEPDQQWKSFMSDILGGWIGKWLNMPEMGFWHEDVPQSISRAERREIA
jgi:hypothetical protein